MKPLSRTDTLAWRGERGGGDAWAGADAPALAAWGAICAAQVIARGAGPAQA
jgi:hypothetical protein